MRLAARATTALVFLLLLAGCGPRLAEQALEAAAPAEYAAWRAAELAAEAARRKVDPTVLEKRHEAGEQLAVLEPQAEQVIRESSTLARAAEAAAAYSDAMWAAEKARLSVVNGPAHEVLNKSGPEYVEALDRLIAMKKQSPMRSVDQGAPDDPDRHLDTEATRPLWVPDGRSVDRLIEALNRQEAVRRRTAPQMTGPEAQSAAQDKFVDVLVALVVVLDNASYHRAKLLQPLLAAHREHFELLFLPPYSPQLAPIERVWRLTRRLATHNLHFNSLDELVAAVESPFNQWRKPNKVLQRLCGVT